MDSVCFAKPSRCLSLVGVVDRPGPAIMGSLSPDSYSSSELPWSEVKRKQTGSGEWRAGTAKGGGQAAAGVEIAENSFSRVKLRLNPIPPQRQ